MNRLRALVAVAGVAVIGGISYFIASPRPGVTVAQLRDAGIEDCEAVEVSAQVRDLCRTTRPDGGLSPRYRTVRTVARRCEVEGADQRVLLVRWPRQAGRDCFEPTDDEAIQIVGAAVDDGGTSVFADIDRCACRARGQMCRFTGLDGGLQLMNFAQTYNALQAPFVGAGCERKSCVEMDGEQGESMPEPCL